MLPPFEREKREGSVADVERERGIRIVELAPIFVWYRKDPGICRPHWSSARGVKAKRRRLHDWRRLDVSRCSSRHEGSRLANFVILFGSNER